jgi:hypothetical protein
MAGMLLDGAEDVEGDGEGAAPVLEGDDGFRASGDGVEEAPDLGVEGLLLNDFRL